MIASPDSVSPCPSSPISGLATKAPFVPSSVPGATVRDDLAAAGHAARTRTYRPPQSENKTYRTVRGCLTGGVLLARPHALQGVRVPTSTRSHLLPVRPLTCRVPLKRKQPNVPLPSVAATCDRSFSTSERCAGRPGWKPESGRSRSARRPASQTPSCPASSTEPEPHATSMRSSSPTAKSATWTPSTSGCKPSTNGGINTPSRGASHAQ